MTEFRLQRPTQADLVFEGELLAEESSRDSDDQPRWSEVLIYRTKSGKYVVQHIGKSIVPGEVDKSKVFVCETPLDVRTALQRSKDGRTFLTNMALDAIDTASEKYPELIEAKEERI